MNKDAGLTGKNIIEAIKQTVENEYYSNMRLTSFAQKYFINHSYLSALFLAEESINFSDFVTKTRLQKAKEFLEFTDLSSEQIAELVGFCNRTYFSAVFTKKIGVTPSKYRMNRCAVNKSVEEYVYISLFKNDPMIIGQDIKGLKLFSKEYNVKTLIEAPEAYESNLIKKILEKVISRKPAGLMIDAIDEIYIPYINQAMKAGIPTITVDCDCPESDRLATVTSDWHEIGRLQANYLSEALNYHGKVAILYMKGPNNVNCAVESFKKEIVKYPDIEFVGLYDDISDRKQSEIIATEVLNKYPNLAGVAGFDSNSVPGFCSVLKKRGLAGKVKVTSVDVSPSLLALLEEGIIDTLIGQKRELFTYFGGKLLYAYNHSGLTIAPNIKGFYTSNIPCSINTGVFVMKKEDVVSIHKIKH